MTEERAKELARFLYDLVGKPIDGTHDEAVEANAQRKLALHVLTKYGLEEYL